MGDCRTGQNGITLFFANYIIFVCSFLALCLGFECRDFPSVLECSFLGGLFGDFGGWVFFLFFPPRVSICLC